jgi:hypothetical protein
LTSKICTNPVLFSSGITADDVDQGAIGTCYFLGDLSGIICERVREGGGEGERGERGES